MATYLAPCDGVFGRKPMRRMLSLKPKLSILCVAAACFLSLHMASQTNRLVLDSSTHIEMDSAMDQPTKKSLRNEPQQPASPMKTVKSMISSTPQHTSSRALSTETLQQNIQAKQNSTSFSGLSIEERLPQPNNENTIIALIAMGEARNHRLAERSIRSIRAAGLFSGHILLFTDQKGFEEYQHSLSFDPKVLVIQGKEEDMTPKLDNGRRIRMRATMIFQRFKTLIAKYASFYPEVRDSWEYAFYLDIDNVVTQDLSVFLHDYHANLIEQVGRSRKTWINSTDQSFISFWKEKKHFQGGQFIAHRHFGQGCLDAWQTEFDKGKSGKDQPLLMNVHNNFDTYKCRVYTLPYGNFDEHMDQRGKHFQLFTGDVYNKSPFEYPTIVHLTGLRTRLNPESSQRDFLKKALRLENSTDSIMVGNITWDEVITPIGPKGQTPNSDNEGLESDGGDQNDNAQTRAFLEDKSDDEAKKDFHADTGDDDLSEEEAEADHGDNESMSIESNFSNVTIVRPTDSNTAIALVAMGNAATKSYIAERCIRSIRASGEFTGYIILFTDENGYETKRKNLAFDPKVIVIRGSDNDMKPTDANGARIKYAGPGHMVFKRFKTLVLKYLDADNRFDDVKYALYLDVDNVVANPLRRLFDDYAISVSSALAQENSTDFSYFSLWRDPGMGRKFWQGGQIMYDRSRSIGCVDAWRNEMDTVYHPQDQPLLMNVYNNFSKYGCKVFELPRQGKHFTLLTKKIAKNGDSAHQTLVHITGLRTKKFNKFLKQQKEFLRKALHVYDETEMMTSDVSWWDVAQPTDARGRKPKQKKQEESKATAE